MKNLHAPASYILVCMTRLLASNKSSMVQRNQLNYFVVFMNYHNISGHLKYYNLFIYLLIGWCFTPYQQYFILYVYMYVHMYVHMYLETVAV